MVTPTFPAPLDRLAADSVDTLRVTLSPSHNTIIATAEVTGFEPATRLRGDCFQNSLLTIRLTSIFSFNFYFLFREGRSRALIFTGGRATAASKVAA